MSESSPSNKTSMLVGILGIFALLIGSLAYAVWESNAHFQQDRIEQLIEEESHKQRADSHTL